VHVICERCGIGRREFGGHCDWCAAPARTHIPFWILFRRWLVGSRLAAEARQGGAVATGVTVGVIVRLLAAALGVAFRLPPLWQGGFLWPQQWWWALVPESWQPWLFAALVGVVYGALAGLVARTEGWGNRGTGTRGDGATGDGATGAPGEGTASDSPRPPVPPSAATVTALVAFVMSEWDPENGTQYRLVAAGLGAVIGRLTTLVWRGATEVTSTRARSRPSATGPG
jgi:hypothetical protein